MRTLESLATVEADFSADLLAKPQKKQAKTERVVKVKRERVETPKVKRVAKPVIVSETEGDGEPVETPEGTRKAIVRVRQGKTPKTPVKRKERAGKARGESREENHGRIGRPPHSVSEADKKKALRAIALGMPLERVAMICGFRAGATGPWQRYLETHPEFAAAVDHAKGHGEADLLLALDDGVQGWQAKAWLLERARGYTMRAQMEHSGPGGRQLSIAHEVITALAPG